MPNISKKISSREIRRRYEDLLEHNRQIGDFSAKLIGTVKAVHQIAAARYEAMRGCIFPDSVKAREELKAICVLLGPYCIELAGEDPVVVKPTMKLIEGGKNASGSGQTGQDVSDSGSGNGADSGQ